MINFLVSTGRVSLKEIKDMLDACAPGARIEARKHRNWVYYRKYSIFRNLPMGEHGSRANPEIQIGWVRQLVRHFEIYECAKNHIANL